MVVVVDPGGAGGISVVPLVVALMFVSVASRETEQGLGRVSAVTLISFLGMLGLAALLALMVVPFPEAK